MPQITWDDPHAVWAAVARRRAVRRTGKGLGGINLATFFWSAGEKTYATTRWSKSPMGTGDKEEKHSEEAIWEEIKVHCEKIYWVFTERAPCPHHPIGNNCRVWLLEVLKEKGEGGVKTPIYWI